MVFFLSLSFQSKYLHEGEYFKKEKDSNFSWPEGLQPYLSEGICMLFVLGKKKKISIRKCILHDMNFISKETVLV